MWHRNSNSSSLDLIYTYIYSNCIQSYSMLHIRFFYLLFAFSSLKQIYGQFPVAAASSTYFPHTLPGSRVKILRQWCLLRPGGPGCAGCNERTCRAGYGSPAPWYHAKELLGTGIIPYFPWEHQGRKKTRQFPWPGESLQIWDSAPPLHTLRSQQTLCRMECEIKNIG